MISLKNVEPPMLVVEMPDGSVRKYDAFEMVRRIVPALESKDGYASMIGGVRAAFDFPEQVTDYMVLLVIKELVRSVEETASVKGLLPVPQS